jgi:glycosyltransferase involved in cell wall biosynthesis
MSKNDPAGILPHNPLEGERPELSINLHDGSEEQIAIIVVHKDRPEYLNITLQSIAVTSANNNYEIIVVDNGSGKDSQEYLESIEGEPGIKVIRNEKNLFWSAAANIGAKAASKNAKYLVFMHSDVVILHPGWLDLLVNVCESQNCGLVGVETQSYFMQGQKVEFAQEWLMMMSRTCFEDVGSWPESLPQIGGAFIMTIRCQNRKHNPQIMKNSIAHHYKIFGLDVNEYERLTEQAMITIPELIREAQSRNLN